MLSQMEIKQALAARGLTIPDFEIDAIYCLVSSISGCLDVNYEDECVKTSISLWASVLIASSVMGRYIRSQGAPSGASQSFEYGSKPWLSLYNQLNKLDTAGCTADIVEPPSGTGSAYFGVVTGARCE